MTASLFASNAIESLDSRSRAIFSDYVRDYRIPEDDPLYGLVLLILMGLSTRNDESGKGVSKEEIRSAVEEALSGSIEVRVDEGRLALDDETVDRIAALTSAKTVEAIRKANRRKSVSAQEGSPGLPDPIRGEATGVETWDAKRKRKGAEITTSFVVGISISFFLLGIVAGLVLLSRG